jgi:hypothetical protein
MTEMRNSSRRSFLKVGAVLATPVGAIAVPAIASTTEAGEDRLARLENEAAVRDLHQQWLRGVNRGADTASLFADPKRARRDTRIASIAADHAGEADVIQVSADGTRATGRFHCVVETVTELVPDCTLTQMKHAQGEHVVRDSARRVVEAEYVRRAQGWAISDVRIA